MLRDLRFGLRILRRHPSFACAAIAVLAVGIGAVTAVFSVLRGVLITTLPYRDPGALVLFRADLPGMARTPTLTSLELDALRTRTDLFASVAAAVRAEGYLTAGDVSVPMNAAAVSANFLDTLGVPPALGRPVERAQAGAHRPVNISDEVWRRHFNSDPGVVGRVIDVNGAPAAIAGVLPRGFKAYLGTGVAVAPDLDLLYFRSSGYDEDPFRGNVVIARLRHGVAIETARAAVDAIAKSLVAAHPDRYRTGPVRLSLASIESEVVREVKPALVAAAGAVLLVLLVACANLTNLLLARASARTHEILVRVAIGARRRDIVRQLLAEGLVIGAIGAASGWMIAQWGVDALLALAPAALPRREAIVVDGTLAIFATVTALSCALVVSLLPAWHATRSDVVRRGRDDAGHAGGTTRGVLVAAQLALSVILLVGAGLLGRAFVNLRSVPLGFEPRQSASMFISLDERWNPGTIEESRAVRRDFYERRDRSRRRSAPASSAPGSGSRFHSAASRCRSGCRSAPARRSGRPTASPRWQAISKPWAFRSSPGVTSPAPTTVSGR